MSTRVTPWSRVLVAAADAEALRPLIPGALRALGGASGGGELLVLVVPPPVPDLEQVARRARTDPAELVARLTGEVETAVRAVVRALAPARSTLLEVRPGTLFLEVIRAVETHGFDLVLKAAERRGSDAASRFGEHFRASTDQHLLRKCPIPVWLQEPGAGAPRRVLAAVDVDTEAASEPETLAGLNLRILAQLATLAARGARELHLVHAWEAPGEGMLRRCLPPGEAEGGVLDYLSEVEHRHRLALRALAKVLEGMLAGGAEAVTVQVHLVRGGPRRVLPETVARLDADLLVMGTVGRSGIPGLLIGNTAEDILNAVDVSLLAVKPPGFVCPLALA